MATPGVASTAVAAATAAATAAAAAGPHSMSKARGMGMAWVFTHALTQLNTSIGKGEFGFCSI